MDAPSLNRMIANRARQLAEGKRTAAPTHEESARYLGLTPLPPRTDLLVEVRGEISSLAVRVQRISFFSRSGVRVAAHLYLPHGSGPHPAVVVAVGNWPANKSAAVFQALGIGHALQGIAVLVVESPGTPSDSNIGGERAALGNQADAVPMAGAPIAGIYAWDLVRGLDYLASRPDVDTGRIGIAGVGDGAVAALGALIVEERFQVFAAFGSLGALDASSGEGSRLSLIPGGLLVGDWCHWLALRPSTPCLFVATKDDPENPALAIETTSKKVKNSRFEVVQGGRDMNRRMREISLAFFGEHLQRLGRAPYRTESLPLTDGEAYPAAANTLPPDDEALKVFGEFDSPSVTFTDLTARALAEPYPTPYSAAERLVHWGRFGRTPMPSPSETLVILERDGPPDALCLPIGKLDLDTLWRTGLGAGEFYAQLIHLSLPGGPEGWESVVSGGDVLTTMIASMRTLMSQAKPEVATTEVVAEGAVASLTAKFLKTLRPDLQITTSHDFGSWDDLLTGPEELIVPGARYLEWPFA